MDTKMQDVGGSPPPSSIAVQDTSSINELDGWIGTLMQCKQLSEVDVQRLCEKVRTQHVAVQYLLQSLVCGYPENG